MPLLAGRLVGRAVVRRADCDADSRLNERGGDVAGAGFERARRPTAVRQGGRYTQSINQSIMLFRVVQVTKSLQDPLEVGNSLPGINDNVRE